MTISCVRNESNLTGANTIFESSTTMSLSTASRRRQAQSIVVETVDDFESSSTTSNSSGSDQQRMNLKQRASARKSTLLDAGSQPVEGSAVASWSSNTSKPSAPPRQPTKASELSVSKSFRSNDAVNYDNADKRLSSENVKKQPVLLQV